MMESSSSNHNAAQKLANGWLALSRNFDVMSLNPAVCQLLETDYQPGDNWPLDRLFDESNLVEARTAVNETLIHGRPQKKRTGYLKNARGRKIPCEYATQPLIEREEEIIGVILSFRHLPEPSLPSSINVNYKNPIPKPQPLGTSLIDKLPDGVFTIDANWRIVTFNRAAETITGFRRQDVLGKRCWEIFRSHRCRKNCPMRLAFEHKGPQTDHEVTVLDHKGTHQTLAVNINVLRDVNGQVSGAVETFHPVKTDRPAVLARDGSFEGIVGKSPAMRSLFSILPYVAASGVNTLICGESGTGKEMIARALHSLSGHRSGPFIAVNCASLPETLLESELFGHEKGAFTGAERTRPGRFELAETGTLFLDEIGEMKPDLQVKLLRVLEQRAFERVGGTKTLKFRARVIGATNQDLVQALKEKRFREDLYYRLRTVPITLPPLRERMEDIPLLVDHFIKKFNAKCRKSVRSIDPKILNRFMEHDWPGNVRELERCIEHAFVFVKGPVIFERYLPNLKEDRDRPKRTPPSQPHHFDPGDKESIRRVLLKTGGRRQEAADLLGISRTSLWRRMKAFNLI